MPNAPLDQFTEVVIWKAVPLIILAGIGFLVLRELLHWIDRRSIRALRPLRSHKRKSLDQEQATLDVMGDSVPRCPLCDGLMVKRTIRDGAHAGSTFWGCFGVSALSRNKDHLIQTGVRRLDTREKALRAT